MENNDNEEYGLDESMHNVDPIIDKETAKKVANLAEKGIKGKAKKMAHSATEGIKKEAKKKIKKKVIMKFLIPAILTITIPLIFIAIMYSIEDKFVNLMSNIGTSISTGFTKFIKFIDNDYWIKLDEKSEYTYTDPYGKEVTRDVTIAEKYARELLELGYSLQDLNLIPTQDVHEEDKSLSETRLVDKILTDESYEGAAREKLLKYINAFIKADLITSQPHLRRGNTEGELVNEYHTDWIDGGIYLYRSEVGKDSYKLMKYLPYDEYEKLSNTDEEKIYSYTIDPNTNQIIIAALKITTKKTVENAEYGINDILAPTDKTIEVIGNYYYDYKIELNKYMMPYEFLISLCQVTQNPEFVYHVAMLARNTKIKVYVNDATEINKTTTTETVPVMVDVYDPENPDVVIGSKDSGKTKERKIETTVTSLNPEASLMKADTWSFYEVYNYKREVVTTGNDNQFYESDGVKSSSSSTTITYKRIPATTKNGEEIKPIEKSKQFLGLLVNDTGTCECNGAEEKNENAVANCAKNAEFNRDGTPVKYKIPDSNLLKAPLENLITGKELLYEMLGENIKASDEDSSETDETDYNSIYKTKMASLVDHIKYLLTFPDNEEINDLETDGPLTDEDYSNINQDDLIVKTDEQGALPAVTKEQLIQIINAKYTGNKKENALSIVDALIEGQNKYKVNAVFVLAFAHQESSIGTANSSYVKKNNNWTSYNLKAKYSSPQENIETTMRQIATGSYYFTQGRYTVKQIQEVYCPNLPPDWPTQGDDWTRNVTQIIRSLYGKLGIDIEEADDSGDGQDGSIKVAGHKYAYKNYKQFSGSWATKPFAGGTMKNSGCTLTSIAIVLTGYGQDVTPETIRTEVNGKLADLQAVLKNHGISSERPGRVLTEQEIIEHLESGRPIIVNVKGEWTSSTGHYMVLVSYRNKDGVNQVYVSNPGSSNATKNGWVDISRITNNMKTASIFITTYPEMKTKKNEVPKYSFTEDKITIKIPNLANSKKVAWVSDVHIVADYANKGSDVTSSDSEIASRYNMMVTDDQSVHSADLWPQIIDYINNNNFDAVIFGGDLMDYYSDNNYKVLSEGYKKLNSNIKKMYIRGSTDDHDAWTGRTNHDTSYALSKHTDLDGNSDSKYIDLDGVRIVGLNWSANTAVNTSSAQTLIDKAPGSVILATHVPFASQSTPSGLEQWCRNIHNNQVYYWADNSYKWIIGNNANMKNLLNNYVYSSDTKVKSVLAGHVHTGTWDGTITENVSEHIFAGAFRGIIGVVELIPE